MESPVPWSDHWECEGQIISEDPSQYTIDWRRIKIPGLLATIIQDENGDWIVSFKPSAIPKQSANKAMRGDWEARKRQKRK